MTRFDWSVVVLVLVVSVVAGMGVVRFSSRHGALSFVWFGLDFQNAAKYPLWQGLGLLFGLRFLVLILVTLLTPAESDVPLARFYDYCRPPGLWGRVRRRTGLAMPGGVPVGPLVVNSALGILACLGLVLATHALFVGDWIRMAAGLAGAGGFGAWLIRRVSDILQGVPRPRDGVLLSPNQH